MVSLSNHDGELVQVIDQVIPFVKLRTGFDGLRMELRVVELSSDLPSLRCVSRRQR
jgi:hypothetical protein